ncbi:MAG: 3-isopropylmalate dehydratase small subunit [Clostridia bacterium]
MIISGKVFRYGDNVDTDVIIPARYLNISDLNELSLHCMEDIDKDFIKEVSKGDIIVANKNFGCGSSREHAPLVIKNSGISLVIAKSFARIFYRNAINTGLAILECPEAVDFITKGDILNVDISTGKILIVNKNKTFLCTPFPIFIEKIISSGGLMNTIRRD